MAKFTIDVDDSILDEVIEAMAIQYGYQNLLNQAKRQNLKQIISKRDFVVVVLGQILNKTYLLKKQTEAAAAVKDVQDKIKNADTPVMVDMPAIADAKEALSKPVTP